VDIFSIHELLLVAFVALLVIGPQRLPETLRTLGLWLGRLTRSFNSVKDEISKEIGMDEILRQLHNEAVMEEMKRIEREVKATVPTGLENDIAPPPAADQTLDPIGAEGGHEPKKAPAKEEPQASSPVSDPAEPDPAPAPAESSKLDPPQLGTEAPETEPTEVLPRSEADLEAIHARSMNKTKEV
jgi:sec-independent protein translocase protein TatB